MVGARGQTFLRLKKVGGLGVAQMACRAEGEGLRWTEAAWNVLFGSVWMDSSYVSKRKDDRFLALQLHAFTSHVTSWIHVRMSSVPSPKRRRLQFCRDLQSCRIRERSCALPGRILGAGQELVWALRKYSGGRFKASKKKNSG